MNSNLIILLLNLTFLDITKILAQTQISSQITDLSTLKNGVCYKKIQTVCCKGWGGSFRLETTTEVFCNCYDGFAAGRVRHKPSCVDAELIRRRQFCGMNPCNSWEYCEGKIDGWVCKTYHDNLGRNVSLLDFSGQKRLEVRSTTFIVTWSRVIWSILFENMLLFVPFLCIEKNKYLSWLALSSFRNMKKWSITFSPTRVNSR